MEELPITRERIRLPRLRVDVAVLGLTFLSSLACASEYCTKEQYEHDHALITEAFSSGMLVKGPKGLRDSILVREVEWYKMNYPEQIAFMQSFECDMAAGVDKHLLYMDVRSLATGKLLATWTLGVLNTAEEAPDVTKPGRSDVGGDENSRIGLTGDTRAAFIKSTIAACNESRVSGQTYCSCYANAMADSISIKELKEASALETRDATLTALQPKITAAAKRCLTN